MEARQDLVTGRTLARIGLALLLLGIVFLYRWGVEENLITEAARVGVGVALSLTLLAVGWATRTRQALYAALLQGGGVAGLFVSAFAAHARYELTSPTAVFTQLVFVCGLAIGLAVYQRIETLAVAGVLGAMAAPMMVQGGIDIFPGDAGYLALVFLVTGTLLYAEDWPVLFAATLIGGGVSLVTELSGLLGEWSFTGPEAVVAYGAALVALWGAPMLRLHAGRAQNADVAMVAAVSVPLGAYFGAWAAFGHPQGLAPGLVAAAAATAMAITYMALRSEEPFVATMHLLPASALSLTAVGLVFEGSSLLFAIAAQGIGLAVIGRRLEIGVMQMAGWAVYGITAAYTAFAIVIDPTDGVPALNGDALARLGVILLAGAMAGVLARTHRTEEREAARALAVLAHVGLLAWSLVELVRTSIGHPAVSAAWGMYALLIITVSWDRSRQVRNVGVGTLLVTVTKVFLIDLDTASGGAKILLLMGFGLALLALGYVMPTERPHSDPVDQSDQVDPVDPAWEPPAGAPIGSGDPLSHA